MGREADPVAGRAAGQEAVVVVAVGVACQEHPAVGQEGVGQGAVVEAVVEAAAVGAVVGRIADWCRSAIHR